MTGRSEDYKGYRIVATFNRLKDGRWSVGSVEFQISVYDPVKHGGVKVGIRLVEYATFPTKEEAENYSIECGKKLH